MSYCPVCGREEKRKKARKTKVDPQPIPKVDLPPVEIVRKLDLDDD